MLIFKIIGSFLVISSSAGMGFYFSGELKCRIEDLNELKKLIGLLLGDIRYASTPLPEAISALARRSSGHFEAFLKNVACKLNELSGATFFEIWKEAVERDLADTSMTKKDKFQLIQLGENLGYLDKDMQLNTLDLYLSRLEEEITDLTKTAKEKTYLFRSLGIMAGVFISIIMI